MIGTCPFHPFGPVWFWACPHGQRSQCYPSRELADRLGRYVCPECQPPDRPGGEWLPAPARAARGEGRGKAAGGNGARASARF